MGARQYDRFDYELEAFFYGNLCEKQSVKEYKALKKERNTQNIVYLPISEARSAAVDPNTKLQSSSEIESDAVIPDNLVPIHFLFTRRVRDKLKKAIHELKLTQEMAADLMGISLRSLGNYLDDSVPGETALDKIKVFLELYSLLKKHVELSYSLKKVLHTEHGVFGRKTAVEFAKSKGELGQKAVLGTFIRIYE